MGVRAALQEWLDPSEEGQTIAAGNFREFSRKVPASPHRPPVYSARAFTYASPRPAAHPSVILPTATAEPHHARCCGAHHTLVLPHTIPLTSPPAHQSPYALRRRG